MEAKMLRDTLTQEQFYPITHWDAVLNKPSFGVKLIDLESE